jgi:hypothetical protein
VTTRIAGIAELVEDGVSGRLVPPSDEEALAQALLDVTEGDSARLGEAGRAQVTEHFNLRTEAARLARLVAWAQFGGPRPARRPDLRQRADGQVAHGPEATAVAPAPIVDLPSSSKPEKAPTEA